MSFLNGPNYLPPQYKQSSDEVEALQTDIMRFMAILGLCLMAIFSIVQSLPYRQASKPPVLESQSMIQLELEQMQLKVGHLQAQVQQSVADMQRAAAHFQEMQQQRREMDDVLLKIKKDIQQSELQKRSASKQLTEINRELLAQKSRLSDVSQDLAEEKHELAEMRRLIDSEKNRLENLQQRYQQLQQSLKVERFEPVDQVEQGVNTEKPQEQVTSPINEEQQKSEKIGFSLRFQSDEAFLQLVSNNTISASVLIGSKAWSILQVKNAWQLQQKEKPTKYYQMAPSTVPLILKNTVQNKLSTNASTRLIWAVTLPSRIESSFNRLMAGKKGGDLVIDAYGNVDIES